LFIHWLRLGWVSHLGLLWWVSSLNGWILTVHECLWCTTHTQALSLLSYCVSVHHLCTVCHCHPKWVHVHIRTVSSFFPLWFFQWIYFILQVKTKIFSWFCSKGESKFYYFSKFINVSAFVLRHSNFNFFSSSFSIFLS
jgi:hypothetical protein